jgi:hypothetical protein
VILDKEVIIGTVHSVLSLYHSLKKEKFTFSENCLSGARGVAQVVENLPSKHKALNSNISMAKKFAYLIRNHLDKMGYVILF